MKAPWFSNKQWTWSGLKCVQVSPCAISPKQAWCRGKLVRDMATPQEVLSSLKHRSLILRPILCKSAVVIFIIDNNYLKRLILIILLCLQGSLSKMCGPKKKSCIYFTTFPCIHSFPWSDQITTCVFFKTYFILVIFQAVAGGKKCCLSQ